MILDKETLLSDAQAVTASAASTNSLDLQAADKIFGDAAAIQHDVGKGLPIPVLCQIVEDFATLTSLTISIQVDDNDAFSSPKTVFTSTAIPVASLKAGRMLGTLVQLPAGTDERYLRAYYTVAGTNASAGKVTTAIGVVPQTNGVTMLA